MIIPKFEELIADLRTNYEFGSFEYCDLSKKFRECVNQHFENIKKERYGIYIIRQRETKNILYIGKGGTIDSQGRFKPQDIPKRLTNVKENNSPADNWFLELFKQKGPLLIEYVFLPISRSPALIEAALLQAYLNEYHRLPYKNKEL
jgi:hypothetical protein